MEIKFARRRKKALANYSVWGREQNNYLREKYLEQWYVNPGEEVEKINGVSLRGKRDVKLYEKNIRILDGVLERSKTKTPMFVYKRLEEFSSFPNESPKDWISKNSAYFRNNYFKPTFVSASLSQDPKGLFFLKQKPILLRIELPVGTKAAYLGGDDSMSPRFKNQNKVLFARNSDFKCGGVDTLKFKDGSKTLVVDMKVIPTNEKKNVALLDKKELPSSSNSNNASTNEATFSTKIEQPQQEQLKTLADKNQTFKKHNNPLLIKKSKQRFAASIKPSQQISPSDKKMVNTKQLNIVPTSKEVRKDLEEISTATKLRENIYKTKLGLSKSSSAEKSQLEKSSLSFSSHKKTDKFQER